MASEPQTALIAGSTGLIGQSLLGRLSGDQRQERVIALNRRALPISHPKLDIEYHFDEKIRRGTYELTSL